ncbi:hypothetical protein [Blastopirellula retiformator]|nr:hypothetical protein [Blastopirellula retiformator]
MNARSLFSALAGFALFCGAACSSSPETKWSPPSPTVVVDVPDSMQSRVEQGADVLEDEQVRILLLPSTPERHQQRLAKMTGDFARLREAGNTTFLPPVDFAVGDVSGKKFARGDDGSGKVRQVQYLLAREGDYFFVEMITLGGPFAAAEYEPMLGTLRMAE